MGTYQKSNLLYVEVLKKKRLSLKYVQGTLLRRSTLIFRCHAIAVGFVTDCEHVRTKK